MMSLDPSKMPPSAVALISMAERWGIGDDYYREQAVDTASVTELEELVRCMDEVDETFWAWLAGPESYAPTPTDEYVTMTDLTMAADSARIVLRERRS